MHRILFLMHENKSSSCRNETKQISAHPRQALYFIGKPYTLVPHSNKVFPDKVKKEQNDLLLTGEEGFEPP